MNKLGFALASLVLVSVAGCAESTDELDTQDTQESVDLQQMDTDAVTKP